MRILALTPFFLPSEGGGERAVYNLSKRFVEKGHTVEIATFNSLSYGTLQNIIDKTIFSVLDAISVFSAQLPSREIFDRLKIYRFPYISIKYSYFSKKTKKKQISSLLFSPTMLSVLVNSKPDIVHIHGVGYFYQFALLATICRIRNIPYVLTVHGLHEFYYNTYTQTQFITKALLHFITSFILRGADRIIALSTFDLPLLQKFGVPLQQTSLIPNGVDLDRFRINIPEPLKNRIKRYYNVQGKLGLTVAAIKPSKGIEYLIEAASKISYKNVNFLVVGDHLKYPKYVLGLQAYIRQLKLQDRVILTGWLPEDELRKLYLLADFFILPTLADTFPLVILEAMAAGKPVIATNVGGIPELVEDWKNGILVPAKDSGALAEAISIAIDDKLSTRMGKWAMKKIEKEYSWDRVAEKTLRLYEEVILSRKTRRETASVALQEER